MKAAYRSKTPLPARLPPNKKASLDIASARSTLIAFRRPEGIATPDAHLPTSTSLDLQDESSQDGRRIVSGSGDTTIKMWDSANGNELTTLRGHEQGVNAVAFSPDGKLIVSGGGNWFNPVDNTLKVWDANNGNELMSLKGHKEEVHSVAFGPDCSRIVSSSSDNTLKVWDANNGSELMTLRGHKDRVFGVAFSPDGKRIVSGSMDNTVKVWDADSGSELMTLRGHEGYVR